jgi:hypothetical protein
MLMLKCFPQLKSTSSRVNATPCTYGISLCSTGTITKPKAIEAETRQLICSHTKEKSCAPVGTEAAHTFSAQDTDMTLTVGIQNCSDTDMDDSLLNKGLLRETEN